ncbi:MAG: ribosomal RNA small subunit methyltransferase G [marine bacterium B5-7]|nr:MAG: ribosomal RNA small subunit methyltransferase G [marine bacterium B5-7]
MSTIAPSIDDRQAVEARLRSGLKRLDITFDDNAIDTMLDHLALLSRWNRTYNLTAIIEPLQQVALHVLDSLSIHPFLQGERVLDIGSGAGFPGVPLAVINRQRQFVLLDARGKKTRFIDAVVRATGIENITTAHHRVESYPADVKFDTLLARAFSSLEQLVFSSRHLVNTGGRILAMKGTCPLKEMQPLADDPTLDIRIEPLNVPFVDAERHLVIIQPDA